MFRVPKSLLSQACTALLAFAGYGQEAGYGQGLSLEEMLRIGLEHNRGLAVQRQEAHSTSIDTLAVATAVNPHLEVEGFHNLSEPDRPTAAIRLSKEFRPGIRNKMRGASKAGWEAQREQVRAGEQALAESIRIAFYDWQILSRKAALQRGAIERWERLAQVATNQVRQGKLSEVDQAEAQLNVVKARQRELALLSEREGKESELQVLVGQPAIPATLHAERMDTLLALPPSDSLSQWASEANPSLLAFRKYLDANRQRVLLEEGLSKPGFSLSVGYERESEGDNLVGAGIEMPLPIANRNQAGILKAKSGLRESELRLAATEAGLNADISALHQRLTRLSEQYSHYQGEVRDLIRKQMSLSEKGFREGLIGVFDLSRVQAEYLTQEEEALGVLEEYYRIWNRLSTLVGGRI